MGLQIGNSKVKEVKIGEIGTSSDYTFTNQPDFTLESRGSYRNVYLRGPIDLNSRIKGTLTFSVSKTYTVRIQQSDGTYNTTSVTGTTIDFDAYCVNSNLNAVSIYWQASDGIQAISCYIHFNGANPIILQMSLSTNFDYIKDTVTVNLTNFQYGTLSTAPTLSYHNIKEIYVGSNKVFPVKQTGWVTAWEGSIVKDTSYLYNTDNILLENFTDYFIASDKIRFIGTVTLKNSNTWAPMGSSDINSKGNFFYMYKDKVPLYNNSNIMNLDTYECTLIGSDLCFRTSSNAYNSGMQGSISYSYSNLIVRFDYYKSYALDFTFNITRIEKYIPE